MPPVSSDSEMQDSSVSRDGVFENPDLLLQIAKFLTVEELFRLEFVSKAFKEAVLSVFLQMRSLNIQEVIDASRDSGVNADFGIEDQFPFSNPRISRKRLVTLIQWISGRCPLLEGLCGIDVVSPMASYCFLSLDKTFFSALMGLKNLRHLEISNSLFQVEDISEYLRLVGPELKSLVLRDDLAQSSDPDLNYAVEKNLKESFRTLAKLEKLDLRKSFNLTGAILRELPAEIRLRSLAIGNHRQKWDFVAEFLETSGSCLEELKLQNSRPSDHLTTVIRALSSVVKTLKKLSLLGAWHNVQNDKKAMKALRSLVNLEELVIDTTTYGTEASNADLTESALMSVVSAAGARLRVVEVNLGNLDHSKITLLLAANNLEEIRLTGHYAYTVQTLETLSSFPNLRRLGLNLVPCFTIGKDDDSFNFRLLPKLEQLTLEENKGGQSDVLVWEKIAGSLPESLRSLTLCYPENNTTFVPCILSKLGRNLRDLVLRPSENVFSSENLNAVRKFCSYLESFEFKGHCQNLPTARSRSCKIYDLRNRAASVILENVVKVLVGIFEECKGLRKVVLYEFMRKLVAKCAVKRGIKVTSR